jgi:hypothetical protein
MVINIDYSCYQIYINLTIKIDIITILHLVFLMLTNLEFYILWSNKSDTLNNFGSVDSSGV